MLELSDLANLMRDLDSGSSVKKKTLDQLRELLNDDEIVLTLNKNSESDRNDVLNWDSLYSTVHHALLKIEDGRRKKETAALENASLQCASTITFIVKLSCHSHLLIKTSSIVRSFLEVMSASGVRQNVGYTYIEILKFVLLSHRKCRSEVTRDNWKDLFQSSVLLYQNPPSRLEPSTIVEILNIIVLNGSCQSDLCLHVKNLFPLIKDRFQDAQFCKFKTLYQDRLVQLSISMCAQTAKESRTAVCQFGEEIICSLICVYDKLSIKGKCLLHDFLLLQVHAHHPKGFHQQCVSSYAFDWNKWNICLQSIYNLILSELDHPFDRKIKRFPPNFIHLASDVFKQVFENSSDILRSDDQNHSAPKRKKLDVGIISVALPMRLCLDSPHAWLRLCVINAFIAKYPGCFKEEDFVPMLELLADLQSSCKNDTLMEYICLTCVSLLKAEKNFKCYNKHASNLFWDKIWETTIRTVGLNQNEKESHLLLQGLLFYDKAKQLSELTNMFVVKTFHVSSSTVQTLNILLSKYDLSSLTYLGLSSVPDHKTLRRLLLGWLLSENSMEINMAVKPSILAEVLLKLASKTVLFQGFGDKSINEISPFYKMLCEIDEDYITSSLEHVYHEENSNSRIASSCCVDEHVWKVILELLAQKCKTLNDQIVLEDVHINLKSVFYQLTLLIEVWAAFENVFLQNPPFLDDMNILIECLCTKVRYFLNNLESFHGDLLTLLKDIQNLLLLKFPNEICVWLCDSLHNNMQQCLIQFVTEQSSFTLERDLETDEISTKGKICEELDGCFIIESGCFMQIESEVLFGRAKLQEECLKLLGCFCSLSGDSSKINEVAYKLLNAVEVDMKNFNAMVWIIHCLIKKNTIDECIVASVIMILRTLFRKAGFDSQTTLIILHLMQGIIVHIHARGAEREKHNFLILINGFLKGINMNKFGLRVSTRFIRCLEAVAKIDPSASWSKIQDNPAVEIILLFLDSPSHEVRLTVIRCLETVFSHCHGHMNMNWHFKLFNILSEKIDKLFVIDDGLSTLAAMEEAASRTASALCCYVICLISNPVLVKVSLYQMLKFSYLKKLDVGLFKRAMLCVSSIKNVDVMTLITRNLSFLVYEWINDQFPMEDLAKYLYQSSLETFYSNYKEILVPIFLTKGNQNALREMSQLTKHNTIELYEISFSKIMGELLPGLQANDSTALKCHKELETVMSVEGVVMFLSSKLPKVIAEILKKIYDPAHFVEVTSVENILPPNASYGITFHTAVECMKYLQMSSPSPHTSLLEFLSDNTPSHIQTILLDLTVNIYEAVFLQDKLVSLYHYCVFASSVASDMKRKSVMALAPHVICSVVHTITHLIEINLHSDRTVSVAACNFLKHFCEQCLPQNNDVLQIMLNLMTNTLVPAVKLGGELGSSALAVLKFIFIENHEYFSQSFLLVNPFPSDLVFEELQKVVVHFKNNKSLTLEEEISCFLQMHQQTGNDCVESLKHIQRKLSGCQEQLNIMLKCLLKTRGFSEDCTESLLHRFICTLIELATSSKSEVRREAGRCLGEIGPIDLGTLVLRPDVGLPVTSVSHIVPLVAECLLAKNIKVVKAASEAMYSLLRYEECFNITENEVLSVGISSFNFLRPFLGGRKRQVLNFERDQEIPMTQIVDVNLWCPSNTEDHEKWVISLTSTLLLYLTKGNNFLLSLIPLCMEEASFSEKILPIFVSKLASLSSEFFHVIIKHIGNFFEKHVSYHLEGVDSSNVIFLNKASVQCMLNLVHFLRIYGDLEKLTRHSAELDLNYLNIARAAQFCNAHFSSILYVELWSDKWRKENSEQIYGQSRTLLELICEKKPEEGCIAQKLLWDAYMKICDADAIYGCGSSLLLDCNKRPLHYELLGHWDKVILSHDMQLSSGNSEASAGLINALFKAGFHHVLDVYLRSTNFMHCSEDIQYECAWRLAKWDTQLSSSLSHQSHFEKYHFMALRALANSDKISIIDSLEAARKCISESLVHLCLESCKSVYKPLSLFRQIQEIEEFQNKEKETEFEVSLKKWVVRDDMSFNQFEDIEPVFWQRMIMFNSSQEKDFKEKAAEVAIKLAGFAREESQIQVAARCIGVFSQMELSCNKRGLLKIEEARLAWDSGDLALGKDILRALLNNLSTQDLDSQCSTMYAKALKLFGDWMVESKSENPRIVIDDFYLKALQILNSAGGKESDTMLDIYSALASFADGQYQNIANYVKSHAYEIKKEWIKKAEQDVENLKKMPNRTKDDDKTIVMKLKQSTIDKKEIFNIETEKNKYLSEAVMYYLKCLEYGDRNNLDVFRIASLWLENMLHPEINKILERNLNKVPSYKFVPILPQMTPRMSHVKDDFTIKLNKLLVQCAEDHPHHTLPVILALANSYKDLDFCIGATSTKNRQSEPRVLGAQKLISELSKHKQIGELVQKMNSVSFALISLAYLGVKPSKVNDFIIPEHEPIRNLLKIETVAVPTLNISVEKSCKYNNIIGINKYETSYSLVGGINAPKKIICVGTDGVKRLQLVKGKDDLRQDAVMQQVFTIMNSFLRNSKHTSKRKLLIRTYKVLPLSQRSGIIEWCENTEPLLIYLTGNNHRSGAHKKYYPNDANSLECREMMRKACTKSNSARLEEFKKICNSIHPVFRYFFLEHFTSPGMWFERRLAYIHSVATSSMIGYILGLGDRHLMNVLVDKSSAEVIHIDFGIAFEMGHILPTPETVPFRLTRDIVDGMGVSCVEGVFRKTCEKTMSVLRKHQTVLLTVLEVLLYDPLYAWTITPSKAYKLQKKDVKIVDDRDSVEVNRMAERALQRLKQKLLGTEVGAGVSVSAQVYWLIQEASDPGNLSRLYFGWEPYL